MKILSAITALILLAAFPLIAGGGHDHDHDHSDIKPSHGGEILEVGHHAAFIEVVHEVKKGRIFLYTLNPKGKSLGLTDAPRFNLTVKVDGKDTKKQVIAKALDLKMGRATAFEGEDPAFKSDHVHGHVSLKVGGKTYKVDLDSHDHDHEH